MTTILGIAALVLCMFFSMGYGIETARMKDNGIRLLAAILAIICAIWVVVLFKA